ncbi:MAG: phosphoribosyltransferase [Peptococcaceae bacterium]|nr:phosphoribosyltransferase [Peptococcaceae bacterium]
MFRDRADAGRKLAAELKKLDPADAVVLCIPRGGVVVGAEVAGEIGASLDLIIPRKIGSPYNPEVAIGAVAQDGSTFLNRDQISLIGIRKKDLDGLIEREVREIKRRMAGYRGSAEYPDFRNKTLILVDDGAATGYTMLAAAGFAKKSLQPGRLIIAVPVAPPDTLELFGRVADEVVCLCAPDNFYAVGQFYHNFAQTTDKEVLSILDGFKKTRA